jgi:hypothetical protein
LCYNIASSFKKGEKGMAYKMTQAGHIVRVNLPNKLPKEFIASVEENPKGEKFLERAKSIIKNAKVVYDF